MPDDISDDHTDTAIGPGERVVPVASDFQFVASSLIPVCYPQLRVLGELVGKHGALEADGDVMFSAPQPRRREYDFGAMRDVLQEGEVFWCVSVSVGITSADHEYAGSGFAKVQRYRHVRVRREFVQEPGRIGIERELRDHRGGDSGEQLWLPLGGVTERAGCSGRKSVMFYERAQRPKRV